MSLLNIFHHGVALMRGMNMLQENLTALPWSVCYNMTISRCVPDNLERNRGTIGVLPPSVLVAMLPPSGGRRTNLCHSNAFQVLG